MKDYTYMEMMTSRFHTRGFLIYSISSRVCGVAWDPTGYQLDMHKLTVAKCVSYTQLFKFGFKI